MSIPAKADEILQEERIDIRSPRMGENTCTCPKCSAGRKKKRDQCLSVKIDEKGVQWHCHHCPEMSGGKYYDGEERKSEYRGTQARRKKYRSDGWSGKTSNAGARPKGRNSSSFSSDGWGNGGSGKSKW